MGNKDEGVRLTKKQRIMKSMALPLGGVRLHVTDNIRAELEGCTGILAYDENEVRLSVGKLIVSLVGVDLQITRYDSEMTVIEGLVSTIRYERG